MIPPKYNWVYFGAILSLGLNLVLLVLGVFGDPGIKKETYLHYTKNWFSDGKDLFTQDSSDSEQEKMENVDDEAGSKPSPNTV